MRVLRRRKIMKEYYKCHPRLAWVLTCAIIGALFGLLVIGNLGIARSGVAFPVAGWFFGACVGGCIGLYIGERQLRKRIART
jgi:hypothetical protein